MNPAINESALVYNLTKAVAELNEKVADLEDIVQVLFRVLLERDIKLAQELGNAKFDIDHEEPPANRVRRDQWTSYLLDRIRALEAGKETPYA